MSRKILFVITLILVIGLSGFIVQGFFTTTNSNSYNYMGSMMGNLDSGNYDTIDYKEAESMQSNANQKAIVDEENNTITYKGNNVNIVMLGGPEEADGKFVIDDLVNPTVKIQKGATITLTLINADEGMPHGILVTENHPPYSYMSMMDGGIYGNAIIYPIPEAKEDELPVSTVTFQAEQSGEYYYICQYPGHASAGMYGKLIIE